MATQQPANSMDAIASLLQLFAGNKSKQTVNQTTQGGTSTQTDSTNVDQGTMAALLKQALESNQGLAAVSQGQKTAGLYNSTSNRLMTNDLLSRMTAQAAMAGASKTSTKTTTPSNTQTITNDQKGGLSKETGGNIAKLGMAMKAYNELGGLKTLKGALGTDVGEAASYAAGGGSVPFADIMSANFTSGGPAGGASDPLSSLIASQGWTDISGGQQAAIDAIPQSVWDSFDASTAEYMGNTAAPVAEAAVEETAGNFQTAPAAQLGTGSNPSSSEVLSGANTPSADTTSISNADAAAVGGSVAGSLGSGITGSIFSSGGSAVAGYGADTLGSGISAGSGAAASTAGYAAGDLGSGVSGSVSSSAGASSAGGNILGYIGPIMSAVNAQRNPRGEHGKDYRHAVGGAVLNYFGFGWASPIVGQVATPLLNAMTDTGVESGGIAGAIVADPIGTLVSGEFATGDVVSAALDPGNIFGGNPGGSVGSVAAYGVDPIGAALGDTGVFSVVKDVTNSIDSAIFGGGGGGGGRVVCTELTLAGHIPVEKYQEVIKPEITLKGRILLGYHVLGVPAVRKLRADPKFVKRALPYVNAYLDHKLGKKNWRGFLIKWIGEPLCWCLSFFNTDPDYYKVLYPYRRNR